MTGHAEQFWANDEDQRLRFRRMPLLAAACWFALGLALARNWQLAAVLLAAVLLLSGLLIVAMRWSLRIAILPLAALWAVAGFWCWQLRPLPAMQHELTQYADGLIRQVRGRVIRVRELSAKEKPADRDHDPAWWIEREPEAAAALSVDLSVEAVEEVTSDISRMNPVTGGVRTIVMAQDAVLPALHCGDVVEIPMRLRVPERYRDPGAWQYADYLLEQGMGVHASVRSNKVHVVGASPASLRCRLYAAQNWAAGRKRVRLPRWQA